MLKSMAAEAVKQHKQIRTTIRDLTLEALQVRELSLKQINSVVRKVTEGVNVGVGGGKIHVEKALSDALAGMDEALLKVVEANKVALQKLVIDVKRFWHRRGLRLPRTPEWCDAREAEQFFGSVNGRTAIQPPGFHRGDGKPALPGLS
jgi:hypothetical protein